MRVNLSTVEEKSFDAVPADWYIVKITDCEDRETKGSEGAKLPAGTAYWRWEVTIQSSAKADPGSTKFEGRKVWTNTFFEPHMLWGLKGLLRACGWDDKKLDDPKGFDVEKEQVIGNVCVAVVTLRPATDQYDESNDIRRFKTLKSLEDTPKATASASILP